MYGDCLGYILRSYKYRGREEWGQLLGRWLAEVVQDAPWLGQVEAIVAVPTHWRRSIARPLYPAEALAAAVATATDLPKLPILRRIRAGPHQVGLSYAQRAANVRGAFRLRKGVRLNEASLLLVDDVRTTGATLEECAKVLRRSGARKVYAAVALRAYRTTPGWPILSSI